jgi:hypothetical protein
LKVAIAIRPGGMDGQTEIDQGLLKASNTPGSDVLSLDCEFTVTEGRLARRKFWHAFTVSGGKVDEKGASIGWNICARWKRTSCRLGSRSRPTPTSAGCAPIPSAAGRARHERELHPVRPAGEGDPRDQGLVPEPDRRTTGLSCV